MNAKKNASVNELLIDAIKILYTIAGNTKTSSDKLDLLKNIQSGSTNNVIYGGNTNNNVTNAITSASKNTTSRSDVTARQIASGSAY